MKIALIGAAGSGKTVYFSALYQQFRNVVAPPRLTSKQRGEYRQKGVNTHVGFRLRVDDIKTDGELRANADLLMSEPMQWPEATERLNSSSLHVQFDFVPLDYVDGTTERSVRTYSRDIELYDPTGGAFTGGHDESAAILENLHKCDMAIAFLPMDTLLGAIESIDDPDELDNNILAKVKSKFLLGRLTEEMQKMNKALDKDDIFPICFVLSKSDLIPESKIDLVKNIIIDEIIMPFSKANPKVMICICSTSVVNQATGYFEASNLEWPFLFAAASTIIRNSLSLMNEANNDFSEAENASTKAASIASEWWWTRAWLAVVEGERVSTYRRLAAEHTTNAGRKVKLSVDDKKLAHDVWASIAAESESRGLYIKMGGEDVDPRIGAL